MLNKRLIALALLASAGLAVLIWQNRPHSRRESGARGYEEASSLVEGGQLEGGIARYRALALAHPEDFRPYAGLGHAYLLQGRYDQALQPLETAWSLNPEQPHLACELADVYVHLRDREAAVAFVERALQRAPDCAHAHLVAGEQSLRDDDLTRALTEFRQAAKIAPHAAIAYQRAGYILLDLSRADEARQVLEDGLRVAPDNIGIHLQLGRLYAARPSVAGSLDRAEQHYRQALANNPNAADVYSALGNIARQRGRTQDAEQMWRNALRLNRNESGALYGLSQLLLAAGKEAEAAPLLRRYREVQQFQRQVTDLRTKTANRKSRDLQVRLARLALDAGYFDEAERQLTALLRERPDDAQVRSLMGELCLALSRPEEAELEFRVASALPQR